MLLLEAFHRTFRNVDMTMVVEGEKAGGQMPVLVDHYSRTYSS